MTSSDMKKKTRAERLGCVLSSISDSNGKDVALGLVCRRARCMCRSLRVRKSSASCVEWTMDLLVNTVAPIIAAAMISRVMIIPEFPCNVQLVPVQ